MMEISLKMYGVDEKGNVICTELLHERDEKTICIYADKLLIARIDAELFLQTAKGAIRFFRPPIVRKRKPKTVDEIDILPV